MKKIISAALLFIGLAGSAHARFYATPDNSTGTLWTSGRFEIRKDSTSTTPAVTISSDSVIISSHIVNLTGFSSLIATPKASGYNVTVGTPGMPGVDFTIAKSSDLWAPLARLGANGLTTGLPSGATVQGKILFIGGPYDIQGATNPAGITWAMIKGSSSAWMPAVDGTTGTIISNYGKLENFVIDGSSQLGYSGFKIKVGSGSAYIGCEFKNFHSPSRLAGTINSLIYGKNVSSVTIKDCDFENYGGRIEGISFGDGAAVLFDESTGVYLVGNHFGRYRGHGVNFTAVSFSRSVDWHVRENIFDNAHGDFFMINGGNLYYEIDHNIFHINGTYVANRGILGGVAQQFGGSSTGTVSNNYFYHEAGGSNQPILALVNDTSQTHGMRIMFNHFINRSGGTPKGVDIQANTNDTFLLYNFSDGMTPYTDAGNRTRIVQ
jgi:hypothetical protein